MTPTDVLALLPFIVLGAVIVAATLMAAFYRHQAAMAALTVVGLGATGISLYFAGMVAPHDVTALLRIDDYALVYIGMILSAAAGVTLMAYGYLREARQPSEELYLLLLLATFGACVMAAADHFVSFFLGLEVLSVSLYALIGYTRDRPRSVEAAVKYLILAGATSAVLLFGMALVYAQTGSMSFAVVGARLAGATGATGLLVPGLALMLVGIGFKLALVPFHLWTPDVYEGAPAPVTALVATVSKGAMFAVLLRLFAPAAAAWSPGLLWCFGLLAGLSMIAGNVLALMQDNLKRIIAYSSIAHLGYALVAFIAGGRFGAEAVTFYLMAYFVTILVAFGVVTALSEPGGEPELLQTYRGLAWRRPWAATALVGSMLSLAGIPLTAGFIGKIFLASAGVSEGRWGLVLLLVAGSAIGLFYYLRVVAAVFAAPAEEAGHRRTALAPWPAMFSVSVFLVVLVWLGVYPAPLQAIAHMAAASL